MHFLNASHHTALRAANPAARSHSATLSKPLLIVAMAGAALLALSLTAAPPVETAVAEPTAPLPNQQPFVVPIAVAAQSFSRDGYSATPGIDTLAAEGTNAAWAKMVLLYGGWDLSDNNVTVLLRWMRQENGADDWFNRNNPLNNGYGSGGGGGLGSYDSLRIAAEMLAENLHRGAGYVDIVAALEASADPSVTASAIWASPWASGHYANGAHWSTREVDIVKAPAELW